MLKFAVNNNPISHERMEFLRWDKSVPPDTRQFYLEELDRKELGIMTPHMIGRPVFFEHDTLNSGPGSGKTIAKVLGRTPLSWGFIGNAKQDPITGSVYNWVKCHDTIQGRQVARLMASRGGPRGCSTQHGRHLFENWAEFNELSLCEEGLRPDTWFLGVDYETPCLVDPSTVFPVTDCHNNVPKIDLRSLPYYTTGHYTDKITRPTTATTTTTTTRKVPFLTAMTTTLCK